MINSWKNTKIYFADFETTTYDSIDYQTDKHTDVYLTSLSPLDEEVYWNDKNLDDFMKRICEDRKCKIIYFHNLSFDGNFIFKWLLRNYPNYYTDLYNHIEPQKNYYKIFQKNKHIYYIEWHRVGTKQIEGKKTSFNFTIKFLCSYNIINASLFNLGKSLKLNKYDDELLAKYKTTNNFYNLGGKQIWENKDMENDYVKYCNSDVKIAKEAFKLFSNVIESNKEYSYSNKFKKQTVVVKNTLTIASLSQKMVKQYIYNNVKIPLSVKCGLRLYSEEKYNLCRNFYSGGFTQFNPDYHNRDIEMHGYCYDINSSYPFSMTKLLPSGELYETPNKEWEYKLTYVEVEIDFIIKPEYKSLISLKNKNNSNSRYSSVGSGKYYFLEQEFKLMQKIYNINIKSIKYWYCEAYAFLSDFINTLYKLKQDNNDNIFRDVYKLLLNTLYGGFAKKAKYPTELAIPVDLAKDLKEKKIEYLTINNIDWYPVIFHNEYIIDNKFQMVSFENHKEPNSYPNLLIGATITSYSRIYLIENIIRLGVENFVYCDTDSIFVKANSEDEIKQRGLNIHDTKLGGWKMEYEFNRGKVLGAKRYVFNGKTPNGKEKVKSAVAGVKKLEDMSYENMEMLLNAGFIIKNGKVSRFEDDYGIILIKKDVNINLGKN